MREKNRNNFVNAEKTMNEKINYLEFPCRDLAATKAFFVAAFGWTFSDYGEEYTAFAAADAGLDGGFYRAPLSSRTENGGALIVFYSENLEESMAKIANCGGKIVRDIFAFPGGRRFHFTEPSGNEFAVWSDNSRR